ncbi:MAG TPA: DUF4912 domain-containing protein [Candidatus Dormibacteraeota bacterium]|nr:DUF4912 domain-containing protein [Candidatus Dormibacteraeota bacterium]
MSSLERLAPAQPALEPPPSSLRGKRYGEDRLYLLVRDPRTVLAVWEVTPALHARAQALARDRGAPLRYRIVIERRKEEDGPSAVAATVDLPDALQGDRWYVKLPQSGGECRAVLGIWIAGALEPLLTSSWVPVPPDGPCAEDGAWELTEEAKSWLLERARAARAAAGAASSANRYLDPAPRETPR